MGDFRQKRRVATGLVLGLLAVGWAGTAGATAGAASAVHCGQTVTQSIVLAHDVGPCAGDGIVVGADGISVNLNGHLLHGTSGPGDNVGIRVQLRSGVVVKGGTVSGFGAGVAIMGGSGNTVSGVTSTRNVGVIDGSGNFGDGLVILNSTDNTLVGNTVTHDGPFDGIGVFGPPSSGNQVLRNVVEFNDIPRFAPQNQQFLNLDDGINLGSGLGGGSHTSVVGNTVDNNGDNGIDACSNRGNPCITTDDTIVDNHVEGNGFGRPNSDIGDGIHIISIKPPGLSSSDFFPSTREFVAHNTVLGNAGDGIAVGSSDNQIIGNRAVGNAPGFAGTFFDIQDVSLNGNCDHNTWLGNTFGTFEEVCTTAGGHKVPAPRAPSAAGATAPMHPAPVGGATLQRRFPDF